LSETIEKKQKI